ncbi:MULTISPECIES: GNAT family N-acetyltransferase [unclassified Massilia]|uniref:GNAT family N-acetyltransferase n=1 Tax=unclassified Massilia TaxID=2609279 RepID=UPI00177C7CE6|nr:MULTISPECIES: GNAT family N-acetyltransferase [unclassified Massilia]MBD8532151.1 N-acetyltransferase [Massilia sp. CFBP 13647]MBD8675591.1 N-acetyltransferase [Massilia sp. CFBP 13721]
MNYRTHIVSSLSEIGQPAWDGLLAQQDEANPFLSYAFLHALHESGSASPESGWQPQYIALYDGDTLAAALPLYVKGHSYGEYVFDWAWADAYQRHGLEYYPKLLAAVPFTPVAGPRLLAVDDAARAALIAVLQATQRATEVSSTHILFPPEAHARQLQEAGFLLRSGVQFHWLNPGYASFDEFLATLEQKKRKNIRAERRKVAEAGVTLRRVRGADATDADWKFFNRCYRHTYAAHYSTPYLNLDFWRRIGRTMPENILLVIAEREHQAIAASLVIHSADTLYGRYWGELEHVPCLHFEAAYYQPLEFCIEQGIKTFEGGAQGEHKMARGFLPTRTFSAHWLAHPSFADAIERFLEREAGGIDDYMSELNERNPFKT